MNQLSFIQKTSSILADNRIAREIPFQKIGKRLDLSRIPLARCGVENVFMRSKERQFKDYAIGLLVDISGSMQGTQLRYAILATHALAYGIGKSGGNILVSVFNRRYQEIGTDIVLDHSRFYQLANESCAGMREGGGNHDHWAINQMVKRLMAQSEKGKILIVLSDGKPSCDSSPCSYPTECSKTPKNIRDGERSVENASKLLKATINKVRRRTPVTLLGIGIYSDSVKKFYHERDSIVITDLDKLYTEVVGLLFRKIRRG